MSLAIVSRSLEGKLIVATDGRAISLQGQITDDHRHKVFDVGPGAVLAAAGVYGLMENAADNAKLFNEGTQGTRAQEFHFQVGSGNLYRSHFSELTYDYMKSHGLPQGNELLCTFDYYTTDGKRTSCQMTTKPPYIHTLPTEEMLARRIVEGRPPFEDPVAHNLTFDKPLGLTGTTDIANALISHWNAILPLIAYRDFLIPYSLFLIQESAKFTKVIGGRICVGEATDKDIHWYSEKDMDYWLAQVEMIQQIQKILDSPGRYASEAVGECLVNYLNDPKKSHDVSVGLLKRANPDFVIPFNTTLSRPLDLLEVASSILADLALVNNTWDVYKLQTDVIYRRALKTSGDEREQLFEDAISRYWKIIDKGPGDKANDYVQLGKALIHHGLSTQRGIDQQKCLKGYECLKYGYELNPNTDNKKSLDSYYDKLVAHKVISLGIMESIFSSLFRR